MPPIVVSHANAYRFDLEAFMRDKYRYLADMRQSHRKRVKQRFKRLKPYQGNQTPVLSHHLLQGRHIAKLHALQDQLESDPNYEMMIPDRYLWSSKYPARCGGDLFLN